MSTTVKISKELAERIDKHLGFHGYTSRTDFIIDAVERLLKHLEERG